MATFPGALFNTFYDDAGTIAAVNTNDSSYPHATGHVTTDAEIIATQTKIGTGASTPTAAKVLYGSGTGTSAWSATPTLTDLTLTGALDVTGATAFADDTLIANNKGHYFGLAADGSASAFIKQTTGNNLFFTLGVADKTFNFLNSSSATVFRVNTSTTAIETREGYSIYAYDSTNTDYIGLDHDGTDANITTNTGDLDLEPNSGATTIANTDTLSFKNAATANSSSISQTAGDNLFFTLGVADKTFNFLNSSSATVFRVNTSTTAIETREGYSIYAYDSTNTDYIGLDHDGTDANITTNTGDINIDADGGDVIFDGGTDLRLTNPSGGSATELNVDANNDFNIVPASNGDVVVIGKHPRRNHSANTYVDSHIQSGWGYIQGDGTATIATTATIPKAYSSDNFRVVVSNAGQKVGVPTDEADQTGLNLAINIHAQVASSSTFTVTIRDDGAAVLANTIYYLFHWIAIGPVVFLLFLSNDIFNLFFNLFTA